jgi:uncharacterized membrane protein YeaQ/YmgE (transglycosylase-associated protein family)
MRRIYVVLPSVESCRAVVKELEESGLSDHRIHVIGSVAYDLGGLPTANVLLRSEVAHGIEWGLGLGALAGLIGGWLVVNFPPPGVVVEVADWLYPVLGIGGAVFGGIVSALLAKGIPSHKLAAFERAISEGQLLVMVDVPKAWVNATKDSILKHHPEARIGVTQLPRAG